MSVTVATPQSLSSLQEGHEPLIPGTRLAAIERRIRQENPKLPDNAVFMAYRQPPQTIEIERDGILMPAHVAAVACFSIFVPHPKYPERPGYGYLPTGRMFFDQGDADARHEVAWRTLERDHRHSSELDSDPAYLAFSLGPVKEAVAWYDSVKDLNVTKKAPVTNGTSR